MEPKYQVYPSLLNAFHQFLVDGYVDFPTLIDRINRVQTPTTEKQQRGLEFEDVIMKACQGVVFDHGFSPSLVTEICRELPDSFIAQHYVSFQHKDIRVYGYIDVMGAGRIIDLKTTANYTFPKYLHDHQTLYLYAMKGQGARQQEYLITDFRNVYKETYSIESYDFSGLISEVEHFAQFLEEHRHLITDRKVFNQQ